MAECTPAKSDGSQSNRGRYDSSPRAWSHHAQDYQSSHAPNLANANTGQNQGLMPTADSLELRNQMQWQLSRDAGPFTNSNTHSSPSDVHQPRDSIGHLGGPASVGSSSQADIRPSILSGFANDSLALSAGSGVVASDIPVTTAAGFFRTYFSVIHPQYPFLDIKECGDFYLLWKRSLAGPPLSGWPAFFVNMIFAIGSLIGSKSDNSPYLKYQKLKSRAQAEQSIMADSSSTPMVRMQAMLLSAMFALHAESTWRIAHVSGVIMKFASLHRFHRVRSRNQNRHDHDTTMMIRVWSCAYILDRAVSSALGTPVSLPDMYVSTPLYDDEPEVEYAMPWLADCVPSGPEIYPHLRTFTHICKIRAMQSFFMHMVEKDGLEDSLPRDLETHMLEKLREWENPNLISAHSVPNNDGYHSALWLQHIGHLTRLSVSWVNKSNIHSSTADTAFQASCDACTSFRSLQKKRQIAQPWLVVLSQFRAAVTLWYILWARAIPVPREADNAIRDCSAVLAIFADRWPNAEYYRDCFEILAVSIPRSRPLGQLQKHVRDELMVLVHKLDEIGVHRTTSRMLWEMCADSEIHD